MKLLHLVPFIFFLFQTESPKQKIFMIGDSTMANKKVTDAPETGWGQVFGAYFTDKVAIQNHAVNGRSTKSFRDRGHWAEVYNQLQKDDYVIIQFGHNDAKASDSTRYAPAKTDYRDNLIRYVNEVKSKGAIPILATPVYRRKFDEQGNLVDSHEDYPGVVRELAATLHVDLLDMHAASKNILEQHGPELSKHLFMQFGGGIFDKFPEGIVDNTHFSPYGARCIAAAAAAELMKMSHPLRSYLVKSSIAQKYKFELPNIATPYFRKDTFDIIKYGAKSKISFLNTKAIQSAIDNAADLGGGVVRIPEGLWMTGPIELKDNINLSLAEGALLQFSDNRDDYPIVETTWEGQNAYRCQAPISAKNRTNIAITGQGSIDGAGQVWKSVKKEKLTEAEWKRLIKSGGVNDGKTWYPSEASRIGADTEWAKKITEGKTIQDYETVKDFLRPNMISFNSCNLVLLDGVTFMNSPAWTLHPLMCNHTTISNVTVTNPWYGQNNDAVDLESCRYGRMENCYFDTGDDAITLKSGRDEEGRKRGIATENWIISNMRVMHGHGGFVIGSEMSGGVNNIYVDKCTFRGTDIGLRFKTTRGRGGTVSDIFISNINMSNIVGEAILFNMYYAAKDPVSLSGEDSKRVEFLAEPFTDATPIFKNIFMDNIYCKGAKAAIKVDGLPESNLQNFQIRNSSLEATEGIEINEADNIVLQNVEVIHEKGKLINLFNAKNITIDHLSFPINQNSSIGSIGGSKSSNIVIKNSPGLNVKALDMDSKLSKKVVKILK